MLTLLGSGAAYSLGAGQGTAVVGSATADDHTRFTLLHTNDEHSHLIPFPAVNYHPDRDGPARGGFARLAGAVNQVRAQKEATDEDVFLVSAGDLISGPPFGWLPLDGAAPELELMQHIGYDAVVVGNHEFDYGADALADYYATGGYPAAHEQLPVLGTNIDPPSDHGLADIGLLPTTTLDLQDGTTIGLFGLLGAGAIQVILETDPVEFSDQHETARQTVADLRNDGADIVVALTHSGIDADVDLANSVDGIDLIVGGHSHTVLEEPRVEDGTPIVQTGAHLQNLGRLELAYNDADGALEVVNDEREVPYLRELDASVPVDPAVRELVGTYEARLHEYVGEVSDGTYTSFDQTVMYSDVSLSRDPPRSETALGNFIADALRLETADFLDERVDFAMAADGLIRENLNAGDVEWADEEVTFYDLVTTNGIGHGHDGRPGYPVVSFWVTEDEILRSMEVSVLLSQLLGSSYFIQVSGGRFEYDPSRATWGTLPIMDLPLPAFRAVLSAERYVGEGVQAEDGSFEDLDGGDELYRVATDYYVGSMIPEVGDIVSRLRVTPKDAAGNNIDLDDAIVHREDGRELKAWEAITQYATDQPTDADGNPRLAQRYHEPEGRLVETSGMPLAVTPAAGAAAAGAVGYGMHRWGEEGLQRVSKSLDER